MLLKYGNFTCLIDCTYKTSKFGLPLFALAVKTNVGFIYVATALLFSETTASFKNVLTMVRKYNPDWHPQFFISDFSEAQIAAIEVIFPGNIP